MSPRHYSIASSARRVPREVELVVSVLEGPAHSGYGVFRGVSSSYLADAVPGQQIRMRVDTARRAFRAGAEPAKNVILVGAGTGVAPFRAFIGDRLAAQAAGEPFTSALCFFGVRHPDVDYLFRDEFGSSRTLGRGADAPGLLATARGRDPVCPGSHHRRCRGGLRQY